LNTVRYKVIIAKKRNVVERLSTRRIATVAVPLALLLAGCGSYEDENSSTDRVESANPSNGEDIYLEAVYHQNGTRTLRYGNQDFSYANIFQVCDGKDLLEQTEDFGKSGNAPERSVDHPACADGVLSPDDFAIVP
jgi:hypothetical protein